LVDEVGAAAGGSSEMSATTGFSTTGATRGESHLSIA
jgi:hypothetical protein